MRPGDFGTGELRRQWFSAAELAELRLPGLPSTKRKINELADAQGWKLRTDEAGAPLARPRAGRGGGLDYHVNVLPAGARVALAKSGMIPDLVRATPPAQPMQSRWTWFEGQSAKVRDEARRRLDALDTLARYERHGMTRTASLAAAAADTGVSTATLWNWRSLVSGVPAHDWLPHLAPRRAGGGAEAECHPAAWQMLKSDYLRPERPTWASCYARVAAWADANAIVLPHTKTLWRRFEREVDARLVAAKRHGSDALRATMPHQQRTVADLHAMELVNIDGHKADVFVRFDDGTVARPIIVAIQDIYSRKMLSWRIGRTEDAVLTRLAFADLFENYGIPVGCVLDNGRAFASKWITGGAKSRFRFKIKEEEPTGLLTALGIAIHWALPFRGSSKPIERAFRDLCDTVSKHPAFAGAYTGNRPDAKPENYGSAAVPIAIFAQQFAAGVQAHNARLGRRTEMAQGRSFDQTFAASYVSAPIGKATAEQLRLALLTADDAVRSDPKSGAIGLFGNRYWCPELTQLAGQRFVVRFDPDDLHSAIHVYARDGRFLVTAPVIEATGFLDAGAAKTRAKAEADLRRKARALEQMEDLLTAQDLAARYPSPEAEALPAPAVVRPVRHRGNAAAAAVRAAPVVNPSIATVDRLAGLRVVK